MYYTYAHLSLRAKLSNSPGKKGKSTFKLLTRLSLSSLSVPKAGKHLLRFPPFTTHMPFNLLRDPSRIFHLFSELEHELHPLTNTRSCWCNSLKQTVLISGDLFTLVFISLFSRPLLLSSSCSVCPQEMVIVSPFPLHLLLFCSVAHSRTQFLQRQY